MNDVDDAAAGRRRRGLILAGIVFLVGAPLVILDEVSDRKADARAESLADDLRATAGRIDDVSALVTSEVTSWDSGDEGPLQRSLGSHDGFEGASFGEDVIALAYQTGWGLADRCVHLLIRPAAASTEITSSADCRPRTVGSAG